jgi:hypothetical protein
MIKLQNLTLKCMVTKVSILKQKLKPSPRNLLSDKRDKTTMTREVRQNKDRTRAKVNRKTGTVKLGESCR